MIKPTVDCTIDKMFNPETSHNLAIDVLELAGKYKLGRLLLNKAFDFKYDDPVNVFGLTFKNRIGLAAGFDKNARALLGLSAMGWGHIEVGTVTMQQSLGNSGQRMWKYKNTRSILNSMGFPNDGVYEIERRLLTLPRLPTVVGVNVGSKRTQIIQETVSDYCRLYEMLAPRCDYVTLNIGSPNTLGFRSFQKKRPLESLLTSVVESKHRLNGSIHRNVPVLFKLSPDLYDEQLSDAVKIAYDSGVDGIVATNASFHVDKGMMLGEVSGELLRKRSEYALDLISTTLKGKLPIISVGGISTHEDLKRRLNSGASLVQLYTAFVYDPFIFKKLSFQWRNVL